MLYYHFFSLVIQLKWKKSDFLHVATRMASFKKNVRKQNRFFDASVEVYNFHVLLTPSPPLSTTYFMDGPYPYPVMKLQAMHTYSHYLFSENGNFRR